jgi:hypothetical protein
VDDLDRALALTTPEPVTSVSLVPGRHVHVWSVCPCGAHRDLAAPRRGRSADRLGKDQERRIERVYGPRKIGEYGDSIDLLGRDFAWQSKATRSDPPEWLAAVDAPVLRHPTALVATAADAMRPILGTRMPLVIQSFVSHGRPTRDRIWVRAIDWWRMHGATKPHETAWIVMSGETFLEIHGTDEETR